MRYLTVCAAQVRIISLEYYKKPHIRAVLKMTVIAEKNLGDGATLRLIGHRRALDTETEMRTVYYLELHYSDGKDNNACIRYPPELGSESRIGYPTLHRIYERVWSRKDIEALLRRHSHE